MIHTATQLKAKIRNLSGGNSNKAQGLIRNYFMERFLERISLSPHREKFILNCCLIERLELMESLNCIMNLKQHVMQR